MKIIRSLSLACLPMLSLSLGCSGDPAPVDAGATDLGAVVDAGAAADGGASPAPRVVAISATGHDRFFGVTYAPGGRFYAVGVVSEGNVAATADFATVVARFTGAGELDPSFGVGGYARHNLAVGLGGEVARGVVVQSTGRVVVAATIEHVAPGADPRDRDLALVRFNADGTRDTGFGVDGVVTLDLSDGEPVGTSYVADAGWGLAVYPDDRLLVTGAQKRAGGTDTDFAVLRLGADGARDPSFGAAGLVTLDIDHRSASPRTATILPDGGVVVAGYMNDDGVVKPVLFRLTASGALDPGFGRGGVFAPTVLAATTEAYGAALQGSSFVTAGYGRSSAAESLDWVSLRVTAAGALDPTWGSAGVARLDLAALNDNARALAVLPDQRVLLAGGGRPSADNVDAMLALLTPAGQPDTRFGPRGVRTYELGGAADFFWGAALDPAGGRVALVGVRGVSAPAADAGVSADNDDAVVFVLPL